MPFAGRIAPELVAGDLGRGGHAEAGLGSADFAQPQSPAAREGFADGGAADATGVDPAGAEAVGAGAGPVAGEVRGGAGPAWDQVSSQDQAGQAAEPGPFGLVQEWHQIQVMFVDDPQGSVEQAAALAATVVARLIDAVTQRHAMLPLPGASTAAAGDNIEQLRAALQRYRVFCQQLDGIGHQLAGLATPASAEPASAGPPVRWASLRCGAVR